MSPQRADGRAADELRRIEFEPGFTTNPDGSVLVRYGRTMVLCTASLEEGVPRWRERESGWMTAEYAMAPGSTQQRTFREAISGKVKGRTHEIQRLIGRSLRAGVVLAHLGDNTLHLDCEVLQADGGTRTASITGAWVAMALACDKALQARRLKRSPITTTIGAVSCGVVGGACLLDLPYEEDVRADVDMNLVMTGSGDIVEIQATGEGGVMNRAQLDELIALGEKGIVELRRLQLEAIGPAAARLGLA